MRGWKKKYIPFTKDSPTGNFVKTDQIMAVKSLIKHISDSRPEIKNVIIDDFSYMLSNEYFRRIKETGFNY